MQRSTRYLAAEAGIRQFLDIGTGIPGTGRAGGRTRRPLAAGARRPSSGYTNAQAASWAVVARKR
jgi:hypothetical protein